MLPGAFFDEIAPYLYTPLPSMSKPPAPAYEHAKVFGRKPAKPRITRKKFSRTGLFADRVRGVFRRSKRTPQQPASRFAKATPNASAPVTSTARASTVPYARSVDKSDVQMRVLKPKQDYFVKEAIKSKVSLKPKKPARKFNWGQKNLSELTRQVKGFRLKPSFHGLNYYIVKWRVRENFNAFLAKVFAMLSVAFIVYLSFFDTFFLIKTYTVEYPTGSYLDEEASREMIENLKTNRILGIFPNNQLWFINDQNLTLTAQEHAPRVEYIQVSRRQWPNAATLQVTTVPTLLTLEINDGELWRIDESGRVISEDTAGLQERVVTVEGSLSFDTQNVDFQDYPLYQDEEQLNRLFFIDWLWGVLDERGIEITRTTIPSLQDSDVTLTTAEGTRLRFNSEAIVKDLQLTRLDGFLANPKLREELEAGALDYVDFRIPKRIFVCYDNSYCAGRGGIG